MFLKISCQWECSVFHMPIPSFRCRALLAACLPALAENKAEPTVNWPVRASTSPSSRFCGFAAVPAAATFIPASTALCFYNQNTLTSIFPEYSPPTLFRFIPPSVSSFLFLFSFLPFLCLPPSFPASSLFSACLPLPTPSYPHTEWASSVS